MSDETHICSECGAPITNDVMWYYENAYHEGCFFDE